MAVWEVEVTDEFVAWWNGLTVDQQESLTDRVDLLAERGPDLGRPVMDRVPCVPALQHEGASSGQGRCPAVAVHVRPRRQVILLLGGDKGGERDAWYGWAVPLADDLYDSYLGELRDEGLI